MKIILGDDPCVGCWSCENTCGVGAISMEADAEGFLYPKVDETKCVQCGRCRAACPVNCPKTVGETNPSAYIMQNLDSAVRRESSSGGAFSLLATYVISQGGVVIGARYEQDGVVHDAAERVEDLAPMRGSKYVQSAVLEQYKNVRTYLQAGRYVLFTGTPCQVAGLYAYLGRPDDRLYTMDFVCHGVGSPRVFSGYLHFVRRKYHDEPAAVSFRDKTYGYAASSMSIRFKSGKKIISSKWIKSYKKLYFSGLISRPACYRCPFKTGQIMSDFRVFDCWSAGKFDRAMDDDRGTSYLLLCTDRARKVFGAVKGQATYREVDYREALRLDGKMMLESDAMNSKRSAFFRDMETDGYEAAVRKNVRYTYKDFLGNYIKPLAYRLGVIKWLKK